MVVREHRAGVMFDAKDNVLFGYASVLIGSQREELRPWRGEDILSVRGAKVGERRPAFRLSLRA